MKIIKFIISACMALAIQSSLDWAIPLDWDRGIVIMLGGLGFMVWDKLDNIIRGIDANPTR